MESSVHRQRDTELKTRTIGTDILPRVEHSSDPTAANRSPESCSRIGLSRPRPAGSRRRSTEAAQRPVPPSISPRNDRTRQPDIFIFVSGTKSFGPGSPSDTGRASDRSFAEPGKILRNRPVFKTRRHMNVCDRRGRNGFGYALSRPGTFCRHTTGFPASGPPDFSERTPASVFRRSRTQGRRPSPGTERQNRSPSPGNGFILDKRLYLFCEVNGLGRAHIGARTAFRTHAGVDYINIARRDRFYRTFVDTGSASGTGIFTDFVSHFRFVLKLCSKITDANIKLLSERVKQPREIYRSQANESASAAIVTTPYSNARSSGSNAEVCRPPVETPPGRAAPSRKKTTRITLRCNSRSPRPSFAGPVLRCFPPPTVRLADLPGTLRQNGIVHHARIAVR